ncbi:hypothetical protein P7C71_g5721, partial [Lecanoromycetidae sp. Uapishka_2]
MHELLLFGQIPPSRHGQILNILIGVATMQPVSLFEKHLVFRPNKAPSSVQGELSYMQLVADVAASPNKESSQEDVDVDMDHEENEGLNAAQALSQGKDTKKERWILQFRDLPEVARPRAVTSRLISDVPIISGDPIKFMSALDYSHTSSYLLKGHRFTHLSTNIQIYRLSIPPLSLSQNSASSASTIANDPMTRLLDPSGTYVLQASVRVEDGSKVETMTRGVNELLNLKETLKGVVELEMKNRLALDTRAR